MGRDPDRVLQSDGFTPEACTLTRTSPWRVGIPLAAASAIWYGALVWLGALAGRNFQAIIDFFDANPLEGYRRLTFMMLDANVAAVSPATTYRILKAAGFPVCR